jgi:hypothetical protein
MQAVLRKLTRYGQIGIGFVSRIRGSWSVSSWRLDPKLEAGPVLASALPFSGTQHTRTHRIIDRGTIRCTCLSLLHWVAGHHSAGSTSGYAYA